MKMTRTVTTKELWLRTEFSVLMKQIRGYRCFVSLWKISTQMFQESINVLHNFDKTLKYVSFVLVKSKPMQESGTEIPAEDAFKSLMGVSSSCAVKKPRFREDGSKFTGDTLEGVVSVRLQMDCSTPVEFPYYAANNPVAVRKDMLSLREGGVDRDAALLEKYRTVLPVCNICNEQNPFQKAIISSRLSFHVLITYYGG